uniref:UBX domain-containing protein 6-like n=1 Tax=Ciona intestinalis TaxID=7719 RepID=UPI000180B89A|nr:UBX domain-containing protein 6-like [Ciona intestinalis]|eukprot:XP_002129952.1 UBX domain-containing protein 6-like [Ciona intestinalis]
MKSFFNKLKTEAKFSRAGPGHKLTDDTRTRPTDPGPSNAPNVRTQPMSSSQMNAGCAALARHDEKSKQVKTVVPKVIKNKPVKVADNGMGNNERSSPTPSPRTSMETYVGFISPFTNEVVTKPNLQNHLRENFILNLGQNGVTVAVQMMKTLNTSQDKVQAAVDIIIRYIDNIIAHPGEEKYQKIRKNNKVFTEKVASVEGAEEFLEAAGFQKRMGENDEIYFILNDTEVDSLKSSKESLQTTGRLQVKIHRDRKIILIKDGPPSPVVLSNDFFKLTSQEVKQEQIARTEEIELNKQLRTKAMRESTKSSPIHRYTIIRIKFPDAKILQGTFRASETVSALNEFIRDNINFEWAVFTLKTSIGETVSDESLTLANADLVPTSLLNLVWNEEIRTQVRQEQGVELSLKT